MRAGGLDLGVAFDGDGDRMLAVDGDGNVVDGDQILAILALHLGVDVVAVTLMTNLGFHRLMEERGIRVVTTDVGDRYVLEALRREGAHPRRRAVRPRDLPPRPRHRRRARRGAAPLRRVSRPHAGRGGRGDAALRAGEGERPPVAARRCPPAALAEAERLNAELDGSGRVLVRASGTEPLFGPRRGRDGGDGAGPLC